jgi:hypothetical protein
LPSALSAEQVWVQANGQVILLDVPLVAVASPDGATPPEGRALALLRQAAVLALEGRPRPPGAKAAAIHAPVPGHAARLLRPLLGAAPPYTAVRQVQSALAADRDRPQEVTRPRRLAHLTVQAAFLTPGLVLMLIGGCVHNTVPPLHQRTLMLWTEEARDDLDEGAWREAAVASLSPSSAARLRGAAQLHADLRLRQRLEARLERDRREREALRRSMSWPLRQYCALVEKLSAAAGQRDQFRQARQPWRTFRSKAAWDVRRPRLGTLWEVAVGAAVLIVVPPVCWVLWAFAVRGGLSFRAAGLALVGADGRPAPRWRCAWRAALVWAPAVVLPLAAIGLDVWDRSLSAAGGSPAWVAWASFLCWWSPWVLYLAYAALMLRKPGRAPHDRLAGTWLVPL